MHYNLQYHPEVNYYIGSTIKTSFLVHGLFYVNNALYITLQAALRHSLSWMYYIREQSTSKVDCAEVTWLRCYASFSR